MGTTQSASISQNSWPVSVFRRLPTLRQTADTMAAEFAWSASAWPEARLKSHGEMRPRAARTGRPPLAARLARR